MIEDGAMPDGLGLRDPVRAIKQVSHDPSCKVELAMESGKKLTAVQLQSEYLESALRYTTGREIDPIVKDVIEKWQYVLETLANEPMDLTREIDWISKKAIIESFMERKKLDWRDSQIQMLDLQYHDSRPEKGLYHMLERQGRVERIVTDEEIAAAVHRPPEDTRAYFRGECLKRYPTEVFGVNWDSISFGVEDQPVQRIMMSEPLKGTRAHVEELLDSSDTAVDLVRTLMA